MKRVISLMIAFVTVCLLLCGCAQESGAAEGRIAVTGSLDGKPALVGDIPCEFPLSAQDARLTVLASGYGSVDHADVYVWQKYEEMTGVRIDWNTVQRDDRAEAVATALTNNQSLDLILRCKISSSRLTRYGESGLILDLAKDDLLKNYAPNCWAYLTSHPETLASIMNPDGSIYSLPQVNSGAELRVGLKLFVNRHWLDNLGLELPTTTEEFYRMLSAFKENDANANGDLNDEIPFCSANWQSIRDALYGAFGLGNRGMHNTVVDCDPESGGVRLIAAAEGYRDFLEYSRKLFSEGLLDNYIFTMTDKQWSNNIQNDLVGVFASTNLAWVPADKADDWIGIGEALEGPHGDKLWAPVRANFHSTGAAVIPATCSDPELVLRWLDYFWTDEGTLFYHMGIENETFTALPDGSYDYMQYIYDEMKTGNKSFDDVVATYSPYPGGSNPTVEIAPYFMGGEMAEVPAQTARALFSYGPEEYWPSFTFTGEENLRLDALQTDMEKYISSMQVEFVTGVTPLSQWEEYTAQLGRLGSAELLDIYQAAADRYYAFAAAQK